MIISSGGAVVVHSVLLVVSSICQVEGDKLQHDMGHR